jgi:two-component system cell cycle sensor histidine kinase/response regulator CckA
VLTAENGVEGLDLYARNARDVHLVLSDLELPEMDGLSAFVAMRRINSDLRAVFMSGFFDQAVKSRLRKEGVVCFLHKPFATAELLRAIDHTLEGL